MSDALTRRDFLGVTGAALAGNALPSLAAPAFAAPAVIIPPSSRPNAVGSTNAQRGIRLAMQMLERGADTLDAAVEGVKLQELDPEDRKSVV